MKTLDRLLGKNRSPEVDDGDLTAMMNWMRIGLGNIQAIEDQAKRLKELVGPTNEHIHQIELGKIALIDAGMKALIERERCRLFENSPERMQACIGARVKITSKGKIPHTTSVARFYDGEDYKLNQGDTVTGTVTDLSIIKNGWIGHGAIELINATSSIFPDKDSSLQDSHVSVHHIFSQYPGGRFAAAIELDLA